MPVSSLQKKHASMASLDDSQQREVLVGDDGSVTVAQIYERFQRQLYSYVYRFLLNQEDTEDVIQEVFVRVCRVWDQLGEREHLSQWLYRVATNLSIDRLRQRRYLFKRPMTGYMSNDHRFEKEMDDDSFFTLSNDGGISGVVEREHIRLALAGMPEEYSKVLLLNTVQGLPYQEIATIMDISPSAAATRLSRAKKQFVNQYLLLSNPRDAHVGPHHPQGKRVE
jgi:RNA polymerase sigma-70 factor, ECF subfamily